jgi:kynurenine formamidase
LPYFSPEAAEFLAEFKNLKVVGIDSLTVDAFLKHDSHRALKEKLIVESLVHLYEIPENARENFILQTAPVRIVGASGGPVVAYAFIELK